jgi:hypothetical protein
MISCLFSYYSISMKSNDKAHLPACWIPCNKSDHLIILNLQKMVKLHKHIKALNERIIIDSLLNLQYHNTQI